MPKKKQTQLFKINPNGTTAKIELDGPMKDKLSSKECYVIVSDEYRKVYLWKGVNSNVRSKFIGAKRSQDIRGQVGMNFGVVVLNEGEEDPDFIKLIGGKTEGRIEKENRNIKGNEFAENITSIDLLIDNLIANIQKNPSKKKLYLRLFLERFRDLSDEDKNTIIQSFMDEDFSILKKILKKKSDEDDDDDERFPYPYIFTHPRPPDDFATATQIQVRVPLKEKDPEGEVNCQYCGIKLTKEEQLTHSCKNKPKNK